MNKVICLALAVFLWPSFLGAEVPAPTLQSDTIALVPLDSGQVAGQIPVWDGEQWVLVNPGVQGDQFKVDSIGSPSWENSGPTEGYDVGCLDPGACNYMPAAAISFPAMCDYLSCKGCTDEQYLEYSDQALIDDGSCATKLGCLDPDADNFDPEAEGTDGSCTYSGIELAYIGEEDVLPTNLLLFELFMQGEDSLYDDIRFYVDGVLEQDTGRYMTWIVGYQPFEVHATALFEGSMRYSDTLLFDPYVSVSQVPIVFDVPIDPDTWLGEGISLVSTVDSVFVFYEQILDQSALELTCDFSSGPDFVLGTVANGDSAIWFSMTYLEAVDTLTISCAKTVTALTMLMPDLAKEEETILNFVEETIPATTQFDSLVTACSSQIQNTGALSLSVLDYIHLNQTASELQAQLPQMALQSSSCPGLDVGLFEWPTLMADDVVFDGRALKYDNCGSDLSYAVQAKSNLVGGGECTSKTYVFPPELDIVGSTFWHRRARQMPGVGSEIRLAGGTRLETWELGLNPDADALTSITVKTYGEGDDPDDPYGPTFDPALSGSEIQGPLPQWLRTTDIKAHIVDGFAPLPDCGLTDVALGAIGEEIVAIWDSQSSSDEEKYEAIASFILDHMIQILFNAVKSGCGTLDIAKFIAWATGVAVTFPESIVATIAAELGSHRVDQEFSQSYVTHQLVIGGQFLGTPIAGNSEAFVLQDNQSSEVDPIPEPTYVNVTAPNPYQIPFSSPWHLGTTPLPFLENKRIDLAAYTPVVRFHPFVAYHQDGALLQLTDKNKSWGAGSYANYGSGPTPWDNRFHLQVSAPVIASFSTVDDGQFYLYVQDGTIPPESSVHGGVCWPSKGENYLQRNYVNPVTEASIAPEVPRLAYVQTQIPNYLGNDPHWNGPNPSTMDTLGEVHLEYQPGVLVNGVFEALPDFPNRFGSTATDLPLSPVVGFPMTAAHPVHRVKAVMEGNFTQGSEYPLPYPGTTVFRDTVDGLTAEFSLRFYPSEVTEVEAPLYAELTGFPSGVNVETVGSCNGCVVSQAPLRVRLDGLGKSPVDFRLDFSEVEMEEDGLNFDIDVWLTTDCDVVLGSFEKRLHARSTSIPGCTDPDYMEYDPDANTDDGSCSVLIVPGCTDPDYLEYDPDANTDDGSCSVLIVPGCTDPDYAEYDAAATLDDGSCECLIVDPACVSPTMDGYNYDVVQIGCQCWFAENLRTTKYANGDSIPAGLNGGQWMTTTDGATAVYGEGSSPCDNLSPGFNACSEGLSLAVYGRLYNWYAVDDARGLCPSGWHVPTYGEWTELVDYLVDYIASQGFDYSIAILGTPLKSTSGWNDGICDELEDLFGEPEPGCGNGTDDFGFSALPGGGRYYDPYDFYAGDFFDSAGEGGTWWSSSLNGNGSSAGTRSMSSWDSSIYGLWRNPRFGFSVRCLRDAE